MQITIRCLEYSWLLVSFRVQSEPFDLYIDHSEPQISL